MPLSTLPPTAANLKNHTTAMQEVHTLMLPCPHPFSSAMSSAALPDTDCLPKKATHRREVSDDELDVFEAARYYSGVADAASFRSGIASYRAMKEERRAEGGGGGERRSINMPVRASIPSRSCKGEKQTKEKKPKQPISPGGRLASFLNSFFHQGSSKKKSKSIANASTARSCKDGDEESPSGRRKRRSSISHSQSIRSSESSLIYSSSSGFRTPSLATLQGKVREDPRALPRSKCNGQAIPATSCPPSEALHEGRSSYGDLQWEKHRRASTNGIFEKGGSYPGKSVLECDVAAFCSGFAEKKWVLNRDSKEMACRDLVRADELLATEKNLWRREEVEDGGESDSSSDLFELPNCDLVHLASGLPVYETTSMENIKRGASVASVTL